MEQWDTASWINSCASMATTWKKELSCKTISVVQMEQIISFSRGTKVEQALEHSGTFEVQVNRLENGVGSLFKDYSRLGEHEGQN